MVGRNEDGTGPASRVSGRCGVRSGDGSQGGGCAEKHYGGPGSPPRGALRLSLKVEWGGGQPWAGVFPDSSAGKDSACSVGFPAYEDPLEQGRATHSGILAWKIPWTV